MIAFLLWHLLFVFLNLGNSQISVVQTSKYSSDRLTPKPSIPWLDPSTDYPNNANLTITIDDSTTYQTLLGFGGALTESSCLVLSRLRPDLQDEVLGAYYGPTGNLYSLGRLHINSCDFSLGNWSLDDTVGDFGLDSFALTWHDAVNIIPVVQRVLKMKSDLKLFASAWSPPAWFKKNGEMDGTDVPDGMKVSTQSQPFSKTWAKFISKWIDVYEKSGIPIWGVTTQNEPTNVPRLDWEACAFSPATLRDFSRELILELRKSHPSVEVILHDDQKQTLPEYVPVLLGDPIVASAQFIGFHWYSGPYFEELLALHEKYPNVGLLPTEACYTHFVAKKLDVRWMRGEGYAKDIIGDLNSFSVGWMDWNILLDQDGGPNHVGNQCDAPIIANVINQTLTYQITYFYLGHFSRFIHPGSIRVAFKGLSGQKNVQATLWKTQQGSMVLVLMNLSETDSEVRIVRSDGVYALSKVPPRSVQTLQWKN